MDTIQACWPTNSQSARNNVGSVDGFPFQIDQPDNTDYILAYDWPFAGKISQLRITASLGSGTCSILRNGVVVKGLDTVPIAANTRSQHQASGNNSFVTGDDIVLRINSGAGSLLNVQGTLVITNKSIFGVSDQPPSGLITNELAMTGALAGANAIPIVFDPPLLRNPIHIFEAVFVKNSPIEDDVFSLNVIPAEPNDFTSGWTYQLSGPSVAGQIMRYAYVK